MNKEYIEINKQSEPQQEEVRKVERRFLTMEVECRDAEEGDGRTVEGYAAVFDTDADLGSSTEQIERGAFHAALQDPQLDVAALFNHPGNRPQPFIRAAFDNKHAKANKRIREILIKKFDAILAEHLK